jgi:hypothetical protein
MIMPRIKSGREIIDGLKKDLERYGVWFEEEDYPKFDTLLRGLSGVGNCREAVRLLEETIGDLPAARHPKLWPHAPKMESRLGQRRKLRSSGPS